MESGQGSAADNDGGPLGVGGMLIASMAHFVSLGAPDIHELLITLFLFLKEPLMQAG